MAGLEVEEIASGGAGVHRVVVAASVLDGLASPERRPADRMHGRRGVRRRLCRSCAARPTSRPGLIVPCALVGASLPGGPRIDKTAMRGVDSRACSARQGARTLRRRIAGLLVLDSSSRRHRPPRTRSISTMPSSRSSSRRIARTACRSLGLAREVSAITAALWCRPAPATHPATAKRRAACRSRIALACPRFCGARRSGHRRDRGRRRRG